jgi:hypothetical protein
MPNDLQRALAGGKRPDPFAAVEDQIRARRGARANCLSESPIRAEPSACRCIRTSTSRRPKR